MLDRRRLRSHEVWGAALHERSRRVVHNSRENSCGVVKALKRFGAGVKFSDAWGKRVESTFFGVPVQFISFDDLMPNKRALGRSSDLQDLKQYPKKSEN